MPTLLFLCALPLQVRGDVRAATLSVAGGTSLLDVLKRTGWEHAIKTLDVVDARKWVR